MSSKSLASTLIRTVPDPPGRPRRKEHRGAGPLRVDDDERYAEKIAPPRLRVVKGGSQ